MDKDFSPQQQATAAYRAVLPPLSPAFANADDAARYAHEQVGDRRDVEYGSVILQRLSDKFFFASEPFAGSDTGFHFLSILEQEPNGFYAHPAGYRIVGSFHSHPNIEHVPGLEPTWPAQRKAAFVSFFSEADVVVNYEERALFLAAYLSGPDGALLKYVPSGSGKERLLVEWLKTGNRLLAQHGHDGSFEGYYGFARKVASVGTLTFLASSQAWGGSVGEVPSDWEPMKPFEAPVLQPAFGPVFDTLARVRDHAQAGMARGPGGRQVVFVLRAVDQEAYIATVPFVLPSAQFSLQGLFPSRPDGRPRLPSGYRLEAIYYRPDAAAAPKPATWAWLLENFFTPQELAAAITQSRTDTYLQDQARGLSLYVQAPGHALLHYRFCGSPAETALMAGEGQPLQQALEDGSLSPVDFVRQVAAAGELVVVETGDVWERPGAVSQDWQPFERLHEALSPAFLSADDAARHAHYQLAGKRGQNHFSYVLQHTDGTFCVTRPVPLTQDNDFWGAPFREGISQAIMEQLGYRYAAYFYGSRDHYKEIQAKYPTWSNERIHLNMSMLRFGDAQAVIEARAGITGVYHSAPDGSLVKYLRTGSEPEQVFGRWLARTLAGDATAHLALGAIDLSVESFVAKMAGLGALTVVLSSVAWKDSVGRLPTTWAAYAPFVSAAAREPILSWLFQDRETAARYAHDQMLENPGARQVAFVLKQAQAEAYVVSDPLVIAATPATLPLFSPARAFATDDRGQPELPRGFGLEAVCHLLLPDDEACTREKWLYRQFVSPLEFAQAIAQARAGLPETFAHYISTRDGAQLRYVFGATPLEDQMHALSPEGVVSDGGDADALQAGTLSPTEFVRRVAAAGHLQVMRSSTLWDVEGRVTLDWQPFARYRRPVLGPVFITADDAARYAHQQIGARRDEGFAGAILNLGAERYAATEPTPSTKPRFSLDAIYPLDEQGVPIVLNEGAHLHALYASRWPGDISGAFWAPEQNQVAAQMFNDGDIYQATLIRELVPRVYLSGDPQVLLAYQGFGTAPQRALFARVKPTPGDSLLYQDLVAGRMVPSDVVSLLATSGELTVVQGNRLWGAPGKVQSDWTPFLGIDLATVAEPPAMGPVFASAQAALEHACARQRTRYGGAATGLGVILRAVDKEEYVVTAMFPAAQADALYRACDSSSRQLRDDFLIHGLYCATHWLPNASGVLQTLMGRHFASAADMFAGLFSANGMQRNRDISGLRLYVAPLDGALLMYQPQARLALFNEESGDAGPKGLQARLDGGALSFEGYIAQFAAAGQLTVLTTSDYWDEEGRVGVDWQPYLSLQRRHLGPAFVWQDDAARYAHARWAQRTDKVYGGLILRRNDGLFVATEPLVMAVENFDPGWVRLNKLVASGQFLGGSQIVARYHSAAVLEPDFPLSHHECAVYQGMFPTEFLHGALTREDLPLAPIPRTEYRFCADGALLAFFTSDNTRETALLYLLSAAGEPTLHLKNNQAEAQMRAGTLAPSEFVRRLGRAGHLRVLAGSPLWGVPRIPADWAPFAPASDGPATLDSPLSPVFTQMEDAVRHAHRVAPRAGLSFGFVLKSAKAEQYLASLPLAAGNAAALSLERVFIEGRLPQGYGVKGVYLCTGKVQKDTAQEVAEHFFSPQALNLGLVASKVYGNGNGEAQSPAQPSHLPLYLSCADNALLKYEPVAPQVLWNGPQGALQYQQLLTLGGFTPLDYVRKVAAAGKLQVLGGSDFWFHTTVVSQHWNPYIGSGEWFASDHRFALSPVFSHLDDAARYAQRLVGPFQGEEYTGAALERRQGQSIVYVAVDPLEVREGDARYTELFYSGAGGAIAPVNVPGADPLPLPVFPEGYLLAAVHHFYKTMNSLEQDVDALDRRLMNNLPLADIPFSAQVLEKSAVAGASVYFSCRGGGLLKLMPGFTAKEKALFLEPWGPRPAGMLTRLVAVSPLWVLDADAFWLRPGKLTTGWRNQVQRPR